MPTYRVKVIEVTERYVWIDADSASVAKRLSIDVTLWQDASFDNGMIVSIRPAKERAVIEDDE